MELGTVFLLLGTIIIVSFLANVLFQRTQIPEPLLLIVMGFLLAPVLQIDRAALLAVAPLLTAIVLVFILLDNGLEFNIFEIVKTVPSAIFFTFAILLANIAAIGLLVNYFLGWPLLHALLLATIIGGTTTDIVSALVKRTRMKHKTRQLLVLESILNDVQLIAFFLILDLIAFKNTQLSQIMSSLLLQIPMPILLGGCFAVLWIYILSKYIGNHPLSYAATVGALFLLYGITHAIQGSGAVAVLTFSLIVGNARRLMSNFGIATPRYPRFTKKTIGTIKIVEMEVSFFVKSLFFVFLGLMLNLSYINNQLLLFSIGIVAAIILVRAGVVALTRSFNKTYRADEGPMTFIMPRGYIAVVLAFLALREATLPESLLALVMLNIFITTVVSIAYVFWRRTSVSPSVQARRA